MGDVVYVSEWPVGLAWLPGEKDPLVFRIHAAIAKYYGHAGERGICRCGALQISRARHDPTVANRASISSPAETRTSLTAEPGITRSPARICSP